MKIQTETNGLLFITVLYLGCLIFASAKDTFLIVYTNDSKFVMKVSLANFGYFKYGHQVTGRLQIGPTYTDWGSNVDKDRIPKGYNNNTQSPIEFNSTTFDMSGCKRDFQQFNEEYILEYGSPIYLVDRGNCSFVNKAINAAKLGKMLIIADNTNTTDIDKILIENDLSGDKVNIPVVLVSKQNGEQLKQFLVQEINDTSNSESNRVYISILFNKPNESKKAEIQYWMIPAEKESYVFFKNHTNFLNTLVQNNKITVEPHFVLFRCNNKCKAFHQQAADPAASKQFLNNCIFDGEYCHPDPDQKGPLTGADSIKQSVIEMCVQNYFPQFFLTYLNGFYKCYVDQNKPLKACSNEAQEFVKSTHIEAGAINFSYKVQECFNKNSIVEPELLQKEYELFVGQGLKHFPALFVNGDIFKGDLSLPEAAEQFICQGIENAETIDLCKSYVGIVDDVDKWADNFGSSNSQIKIWIFSIVLLIFFIVGLFIYRRKMKIEMQKELALQVDTAIQQYYALSESKQ